MSFNKQINKIQKILIASLMAASNIHGCCFGGTATKERDELLTELAGKLGVTLDDKQTFADKKGDLLAALNSGGQARITQLEGERTELESQLQQVQQSTRAIEAARDAAVRDLRTKEADISAFIDSARGTPGIDQSKITDIDSALAEMIGRITVLAEQLNGVEYESEEAKAEATKAAEEAKEQLITVAKAESYEEAQNLLDSIIDPDTSAIKIEELDIKDVENPAIKLDTLKGAIKALLETQKQSEKQLAEVQQELAEATEAQAAAAAEKAKLEEDLETAKKDLEAATAGQGVAEGTKPNE